MPILTAPIIIAPGFGRAAGPRFGVDGTLERFTRLPYVLPGAELEAAVQLLVRARHRITGRLSAPPQALVV